MINGIHSSFSRACVQKIPGGFVARPCFLVVQSLSMYSFQNHPGNTSRIIEEKSWGIFYAWLQYDSFCPDGGHPPL